MSDKIIIFDTTLRDGEQSPGATMSMQEKLMIAGLLDGMGVDVIEAGFAAASPGDMACIDAVCGIVRNASVCSLARAVKADIEVAAKSLAKAVKPRIHTFISTSDIHIEHQFQMTKEQVLERIDETVRYARLFCDDVEWSAMDATRSDPEFLKKAVGVAVKAGAGTINIPDTVGYALPEDYKPLIAMLCQAYPDVIFSVHCHNDLGLATANSLAGISGGARQVECTINGIGERAGNTAMEEVVMAIKTRPDFFNFETGIETKKIFPISRFVAAATGFAVQKNKAIVGANAFAHESGIHQDGMLKNRNTYEIIAPETVGVNKTQIVLGKHSGRAALKSKVNEWGVKMEDDEFQVLFTAFKSLCDRKKHVTEEDIMAIMFDYRTDEKQQLVQLESFNMDRHADGQYSAEITVKSQKQNQIFRSEGDGPLDAIFKAMHHLISGDAPSLVDFEVHSISHGTDAQAEAKITLDWDDELYTGHARDTDTIMAASRAYMTGINKILSRSVKGGRHAA
ncbi:MAG: 2-isopropylmalate synthase [Alphaproteobacteria bacterium]